MLRGSHEDGRLSGLDRGVGHAPRAVVIVGDRDERPRYRCDACRARRVIRRAGRLERPRELAGIGAGLPQVNRDTRNVLRAGESDIHILHIGRLVGHGERYAIFGHDHVGARTQDERAALWVLECEGMSVSGHRCTPP